jgi:hypothetical protein
MILQQHFECVSPVGLTTIGVRVLRRWLPATVVFMCLLEDGGALSAQAEGWCCETQLQSSIG